MSSFAFYSFMLVITKKIFYFFLSWPFFYLKFCLDGISRIEWKWLWIQSFKKLEMLLFAQVIFPAPLQCNGNWSCWKHSFAFKWVHTENAATLFNHIQRWKKSNEKKAIKHIFFHYFKSKILQYFLFLIIKIFFFINLFVSVSGNEFFYSKVEFPLIRMQTSLTFS